MKVGFTGTREGMTEVQSNVFISVIAQLKPTEFHFGLCVGADEEAVYIVGSMFGDSCKIVGHPPANQSLVSEAAKVFCNEIREPKPYLDRDKDIVDETEKLTSTPKGSEILRSGTWATSRYARKLGRPIIIIYPDGSIVEEPAK